MFKGVSKQLVHSAVQRDIIKSEAIEEHVYGLNAFMTITVNILSALIIGLTMNMLFEIILFIMTYKIIRKYTGGGHSKTAMRCYISSCATYIAALLIIKYYPFSSLISTIMVFVSAIILYVISPVEADKKPLDDIERKVFRHRSHVIIILLVCIFLVLHYAAYVPCTYCSIVIAVSFFTVSVFAIEGKLHQIQK